MFLQEHFSRMIPLHVFRKHRNVPAGTRLSIGYLLDADRHASFRPRIGSTSPQAVFETIEMFRQEHFSGELPRCARVD